MAEPTMAGRAVARNERDDAAEETPCNCLAVRQAARHVTQIYERHLAHEGLRASQYSILSKLGRLAPLSIGELAAAMVMDRTSLGRAIRPLARDGLLAMGRGRDGRTRSISLTARGRAKLKAASAHWRKAQDEFEAAYGVAASRDLRATLRRVVAAT
jgi:DNA-binding MarR family transcriptional regulator